MAENIRDDAKEKGDVAREESEAAMLRVVSVIRELEEKGEIFLVLNEG